MNDQNRANLDEFLEENMPNAEKVFEGALAKFRELFSITCLKKGPFLVQAELCGAKGQKGKPYSRATIRAKLRGRACYQWPSHWSGSG
jgi:hypothetical protein